MGLRFRQSMKLMPGVRLNFSKETVGLSFGVPGMRYTMNSKGRRTLSTGIPGTGIYNIDTLSSGRTSRSSRSSSSDEDQEYVAPEPNVTPSLFARKHERAFFAFMKDIYGGSDDVRDSATDSLSKAEALALKFPLLKEPLDAMIFLQAAADDATVEVANRMGAVVWANRDAVFNNVISIKYFKGISPSFPITRGINSSGIYNLQSFGFLWAESLQGDAKYQEAIDVLAELNPDQLVGIALADVEITMGDFDGAIETTEDIENEDDATAIMLILRGIAFRGKDLDDASLECFRRALASKKRSEGVLHRALFERSITYTKVGKKAMARKDLEKILVDDPSAEHVNEALEKLA